MSDQVDIRTLKMQLLQLQQQLAQIQAENAGLRQKCSEWYTWSQSAQQTIAQKESQITTLQTELNALKSQKKAFEDKIGTRTVSDMYDQNQQREIEVREFKYYSEELSKIVYTFLTAQELSAKERDEIAKILVKSGALDAKIVSALILEGKAMSTSQLAKKVNATVGEAQKAAERLAKEQFIAQVDNEIFSIEKTTTVTKTDYKSADIKNVVTTIETRLTHANTISQACDILEEFANALTAQGNMMLSSEISRKTADYRRRSHETKVKEIIAAFQGWKGTLQPTPKTKETPQRSSQIDVQMWIMLSFADLIVEVKNEIKQASNTATELLAIVEKFKEAIQTQGGHATLVYAINRFINEYKNSSTITKSVLMNQIDEWGQ